MSESAPILLANAPILRPARIDVLLDTSGLLCYLDAAEIRHLEAVTLFEAETLKITHNYVLVEFVELAHARKYPRHIALSFVADIAIHPDVEVVWVDQERRAAGLAMLQAQLDKSYSLCDAISFLLMTERAVREALTTDRHFEQAGFRRFL